MRDRNILNIKEFKDYDVMIILTSCGRVWPGNQAIGYVCTVH